MRQSAVATNRREKEREYWTGENQFCLQFRTGYHPVMSVFAKSRPSIRLATRFDAEGREIEVEVREDEESTRCQQEIMDVLVSSGYYRAYIKGEWGGEPVILGTLLGWSISFLVSSFPHFW